MHETALINDPKRLLAANRFCTANFFCSITSSAWRSCAPVRPRSRCEDWYKKGYVGHDQKVIRRLEVACLKLHRMLKKEAIRSASGRQNIEFA
jgi:hypothetical protein